MPYAINLILDDPTAAPVRALMRGLSGAGDHTVAETYAPHLTLAVMPDCAEPGEIQNAAFDGLVLSSAIPVTLSGIGVFPKAGAVWLAAAATAQIIALQQSLLAALGDVPVDPLYGQGQWVPHVTLGRGSTHELAQAIAQISSLWDGPVRGFANRLELATFHPVQVLRSRELPPFG